jgi:integrase
LLFLYREVLTRTALARQRAAGQGAQAPAGGADARRGPGRAVPAVEVTHWLIASLLYGSGMRIMECLRLRVKDIDFARGEILVRDGKGFKDRVTMLPAAAWPRLRGTDVTRAGAA